MNYNNILKIWYKSWGQMIGFYKIDEILEKSFCLKSSVGTKKLVFTSELRGFQNSENFI